MTQTPQQIADEMTRLLADDDTSPLDIIQAQAIQNLQAQAGKQDEMEYQKFCKRYNRTPSSATRRVYLIQQLGFEIGAHTFEREDALDKAAAERNAITEAEQQAAEAQEIDDWIQSDNAAPLYGDWSEPSDEYKRMADALRPDPDEPDDLYNYARGG